METLSKTQQNILDYCLFENRKQLEQGKLEGIDTISVAIDLKLDRGNTSRNLNSLYRKGHVIKIEGRPTLYVAALTLNEIYPNTFVPATFSNNDLFQNFLKLKDSQKQQVKVERFIGNNPGESLQEPYEQCLNSLLYPPHGIDIFLTGQIGVGKLHFVKSVFTRLLERNVYESYEDLVIINCRQVKQSFFSYLDSLIYKNNHRKLFVLNNIENLDPNYMIQFVEIISAKLNNISNYLDEYKRHHYIVVCNENHKETMESFKTIFPTKVEIPSFDEKTLREKALFIMNYFYDEAVSLNKKVLLSKKALDHFLFASYRHNLVQLRSEIKSATLSAISTQYTEKEIHIETTNLSADLMMTVKTITDKDRQVLELLYQFLPYEYLIINPSDSILNVDELFPHLKTETKSDTLSNYCKQLIHSSNQFVLQHGTQKIYLEIEKAVTSAAGSILKNNKIYLEILASTIFDLVSDPTNLHQLQSLSTPYKVSDKVIQKASGQIIGDLQRITNNKRVHYLENMILYFLNMTKAIVNDSQVQLLLVTKSESVSKTYIEYAKAFYTIHNEVHLDNIHDIVVPNTSFENDKLAHQAIVDKCKAINQGKGIYVLLMDGYSNHLLSMLNQHSTYGLFASKPITHKAIERFLLVSNNPLVFADDIETIPESLNDVLINEPTQKELKQMIMDNALISNLTYLNPHKIIDPVIRSFFNVCHDLSIGISENLYIKYIVHLCFMLERSLQDDVMNFRKVQEFETKHQPMFLAIEKSLTQVQSLLDIKEIRKDEIAYLAQILLDL